jgi:hypothetical protein
VEWYLRHKAPETPASPGTPDEVLIGRHLNDLLIYVFECERTVMIPA